MTRQYWMGVIGDEVAKSFNGPTAWPIYSSSAFGAPNYHTFQDIQLKMTKMKHQKIRYFKKQVEKPFILVLQDW